MNFIAILNETSNDYVRHTTQCDKNKTEKETLDY